MANDFNKWIGEGRLCKDPELTTTTTGKNVCKFSIANNRSYGSGDGKKEEVSFFNCVAWEKTGEIIAKHATKGTKILIEARLSARSYEKDGARKYVTVLIVENFKFIGSKQSSEKAEAEDTQLQTAFGDIPADIPF